MFISIVAAVSKNGVIGINNQLPWHIPEEFKHFKKLTIGKPIIMGRKTLASMENKPLPHRSNIILTNDLSFSASGVSVTHSIDEAIAAAGEATEIMVIGGAEIFNLFLPLAQKIYLSVIDQNLEGDTFFPEPNWSEWQLVQEVTHERFIVKEYVRHTKFSHNF